MTQIYVYQSNEEIKIFLFQIVLWNGLECNATCNADMASEKQGDDKSITI